MTSKLLTLIFVFLTCFVHAQTLKTYSGPYENGTATYQYYEDSNGERVYHGSFTFKGSEGTIKIVGSYKNGKRNGYWLCTLYNHDYLLLTITGKIEANYINGNREGLSTYALTRNLNEFDVTGNETESCKINFKNNIPFGEYYHSYVSKLNSIVEKKEKNIITKGFFDVNGYKTGDWIIKSVKNNFPTEELKKYQKGYCYWYISRVSSTGEINKRFDSTEYANNYLNSNETFKKDNYNYALGFPQGSVIGRSFIYIGDHGANPFVDNTGDRSTIQDTKGLTEAEFLGTLGWHAFLNSKYYECIEISNKALALDSTLLFVKLNIALTKLKLNNPEFYNAYLAAVSCCNNIKGRKEALEDGIKAIEDITSKEFLPNADKAILIIKSEINDINNKERALALKRQKEIEDQKEKQNKLIQEKIELANSDFGKLISQIKKELKLWEQKNNFETEEEYQNRLKTKRIDEFSKIRNEIIQNYQSLNQSLSSDNLSLVGRIAEYDAENRNLIIKPANVGTKYERNVALAALSNYNKNLSDDYNIVSRNSEYNLKISSPLAKAISDDIKKEIILVPKEFVLYNNNWRISKAFIIFILDHSPKTVKGISASDKSVSIEVEIFIPAKDAFLVTIPSRTKNKTIQILKFSELEKEFSQTNILPEKFYYYYWTIEEDNDFSKDNLRELNVAISDIE